MPWAPVAAVVVAGIIFTVTDWLFMGILFHERYMRYPEVWWPGIREKGDKPAIVYSCALGFVSAAAVVMLCAISGASNLKSALIVAALAWAAGPLVNTVTNNLWIKFDPAVTAAHALGYLVRFLVAGAAYALIV